MTENTPAQIGVLVADDHPVVREGMVSIIERMEGFYCIGQASGARESVRKWQELSPDIGLFDLRMPDGDAVSAITQIRDFDEEAKVLVVSSFDADEEVYRVMNAGAYGYMLKDSEPDSIRDALKNICTGKRHLPPVLANKLADRVCYDDLSARETEILSLAATGIKTAQIADTLCLSQATIKFHLNNIYSKLGVSSRTAAIAVAVKRGIIAIA